MVDRSPLIIGGKNQREFNKDSDGLLVNWGNLHDVDMSTNPPDDTNAAIFDGENWIPVRGEVITEAPNPSLANAGTFHTLKVSDDGTKLEYWQDFDIVLVRKNGLINITNTFATFLSGAVNFPILGNYLVTTSYTWSYSSSARDFLSRLLLNSTTLWDQRQEPSDSLGGGINLPNVSGGTSNSGTDQRFPQTKAFLLEDQPAGEATLDFQFSRDGNNDQATIYDALIRVERIKG